MTKLVVAFCNFAANAACNKKKNLYTSKFDLYFRKKLVKCCIWNIALYGAENWTLRKVYQKYEENSAMCRRRMEMISWTDCLRNEEILQEVK
jgi:hypothetical protein